MTKRTQSARIIDYLATGKRLTVVKALNRFGCYALSQRIGELKCQGHDIRSHMVKRNRARIAEYWLAR